MCLTAGKEVPAIFVQFFMNRLSLSTCLIIALSVALCDAGYARSPKRQPARYAVLAPSLDVLYVGVNNRLVLNSYGYLFKNFEITVDNGSTKSFAGFCTIIPNKAGKVIINVNYLENGKRKNIQQLTVDAINLPPALFSLGNKKLDLSTDELLKSLNPKVISPIYQYYIPFALKSFTAIIISGNNKVNRYECVGDVFSEELRKKIKEMKRGDLIVFTDVVATNEGTGITVPVESKTVRIY